MFSFVVLYKDPLPSCPAVCLSGDIQLAKGKDFAPSKDVLLQKIWKSVYAVVSSDGYLHLLSRQMCDMPDVSFCLKVSVLVCALWFLYLSIRFKLCCSEVLIVSTAFSSLTHICSHHPFLYCPLLSKLHAALCNSGLQRRCTQS